MSDTTPGVAATTGFGVAFVLAGGALLLQEWDLLTIRWTFLLPVMITVVGVVVLLSGLTGAHRSRPRPARVPPVADGPAALDELQGHDPQGFDNREGHLR